MTDPTQNDPQELARRFNEDEAVWRGYQKKRLQLLFSGSRRKLTAEEFERLAWAEAEAEVRPMRCIGIEVP